MLNWLPLRPRSSPEVTLAGGAVNGTPRVVAPSTPPDNASTEDAFPGGTIAEDSRLRNLQVSAPDVFPLPLGGRTQFFYHNWAQISQDAWMLQTIQGFQLDCYQTPSQITQPRQLAFSQIECDFRFRNQRIAAETRDRVLQQGP